jgi:hypothetical protein
MGTIRTKTELIQRTTRFKIEDPVEGTKQGIVEDVALAVHGASTLGIVVHLWVPDNYQGNDHLIVSGEWLEMKLGSGSIKIL